MDRGVELLKVSAVHNNKLDNQTDSSVTSTARTLFHFFAKRSTNIDFHIYVHRLRPMDDGMHTPLLSMGKSLPTERIFPHKSKKVQVPMSSLKLEL